MPASATPSLIARLTRRRPRTLRQPEPADMGTAFGMEQWLDERDHGGVPAGSVTLSSGASTCVATLPATSCALTFAALGARTISAAYNSADGNHLASSSSGAGNMQSLVFALADLAVTKTDLVTTYRPGDLIVYTSADSVFQIAAHESVVPLDELYRACEIARTLCDERNISRVIARPFVGEPGKFRRTYNRRDYAMPPPEATALSRIADSGRKVVGVGKIWDIFAGHGITDNIHSEGNTDGLRLTLEALDEVKQGLIFVNLVDFDMLYGHRRDPQGYGSALAEFDAFLPSLRSKLGPRDLVLLTADHGNDPTWPGSDHTREDVPLLAFTERAPSAQQADLGVRDGFFDVAQTLCDAFALPAWPRGKSVLPHLLPS